MVSLYFMIVEVKFHNAPVLPYELCSLGGPNLLVHAHSHMTAVMYAQHKEEIL